MTAQAATPQTDSRKAAPLITGTDYVILAKSNHLAGADVDVTAFSPGVFWIEQGHVNARDTDKAIEKYAEQNGNKAGTFVAIPSSRWKPTTVTPQTVTTLKLEEAK